MLVSLWCAKPRLHTGDSIAESDSFTRIAMNTTENADFTDAYIGDFDIRNLCKNPTLKGENPLTGADTRLSANCGPGR